MNNKGRRSQSQSSFVLGWRPLWREGQFVRNDKKEAVGNRPLADDSDGSPNLVYTCDNYRRINSQETKSQKAFRWSVEHLFDHSVRVYLWTFTFKDAMPSWCCGPTWYQFLKAYTQQVERFRGVRVFEWHVNHGLHIHALIDRRLPIQEVRRIAKRFGFGRLHVIRADIGTAMYLSKYLGKQHGRIPFGGRAWSRIGGTGHAVRDIQYVSKESSEIKSRVAYHMSRGVPVYAALEQANRDVILPSADEIEHAIAMRDFDEDTGNGSLITQRNSVEQAMHETEVSCL